jgi:beta-lactam-binding protein with PASTA domain
LNPGVLKEKELAEARAVFEKHGLSVAREQRKKGEKAEGKVIR